MITSIGAKKIAEVIEASTTLQMLDISYCGIPTDGILAINNCLKCNTSLPDINISNNTICVREAIIAVTEVIRVNSALKKFDALAFLIME